MRYLRQSTASQEVILGPFVDATDGTTAMTGLTIANTDIKVYKAGATTSANKNSGGATHDAAGRYYAVLDATDTDTLGSGEIHVSVAGALPVKINVTVLPANIFDSMILGTDLFDVSVTQFGGTAGTFASGRPEVNTSHLAGSAVSASSGLINANVTQISGDSAAADSLEAHFDDTAGAYPLFGVVDRGTAQSATSTTLVLRSAAAFANDELIGATIVITGGSTGVGQSRRITDYVQSTDTATVEAWTTTPSGTITYVIYGTAADSGGGGGLDAAGVRAAIGLASANLDTQLSTIDTVVDRIEVDTQDLQARTPASLVSGRMDVSVGAMAANVMTASALASDAVAEIQTGLATASALATVDTVVDAILVDTDTTIPAQISTLATVADRIEADTQDLQARTPAALVGGRVDASVGAMAAGVVTAAAVATGAIDADAIAADAVTEIQAGLATASALSTLASAVSTVDAVVDAVLEDTGTTLPATLSTIAGYLDTEVQAIKAQTDKLTFNASNAVKSNVSHVIDDAVVSGSAKTTTWGGTA